MLRLSKIFILILGKRNDETTKNQCMPCFQCWIFFNCSVELMSVNLFLQLVLCSTQNYYWTTGETTAATVTTPGTNGKVQGLIVQTVHTNSDDDDDGDDDCETVTSFLWLTLMCNEKLWWLPLDYYESKHRAQFQNLFTHSPFHQKPFWIFKLLLNILQYYWTYGLTKTKLVSVGVFISKCKVFMQWELC